MKQEAAAAEPSMAKPTQLPDAATVEINRMIADISFAIDLLDGRDLQVASEYIGLLSRLPLDESVDELADAQLREHAINCANSLTSHDPEMLTVVHALLDAIGRARANRRGTKDIASRRQNTASSLEY